MGNSNKKSFNTQVSIMDLHHFGQRISFLERNGLNGEGRNRYDSIFD
jgi:hypothetical protein